MKNQIKLDNINLIKALLNEGNKKEFNQTPENVWAVCYEFYKFFEVYKDELKENHEIYLKETIDKIIETNETPNSYHEFPLFCLTAFANSYNNYKEKENEVY
jgi:DNA-binding transcriptional regulator GbsR (MarR family)